MNRQEALDFLQTKLKNKNLVKHSIAVECSMIALAEHFNEDTEMWGLTGLLHDIDYEERGEDMSQHSKMGADILRDAGFDEVICDAVLTHNSYHGLEPNSLMAKAIICVDSLTGLIVAATLVLPSRKIEQLSTESVLNRFNEPRFAAGANREEVALCKEYLELELDEFVGIVLRAMQNRSEELGL